MSTLILKLNAAGDVVRTTCLLRRLTGHVTWITTKNNVHLLPDGPSLRVLTWERRELALDRVYDLIINLEDDVDCSTLVRTIPHRRLFGAHLGDDNTLSYTPDSSRWFDLGLISVHGRARADELKFANRSTYQELICEGLGLSFDGAEYVLPPVSPGPLRGDVAIAPAAGPVWPMKGWAYYESLATELRSRGHRVTVLELRPTLKEHMADILGHRCLVGGDSLPMHLALGLGVRCVTLFNCTSPWEIYDYGLQTKLVSPLLGEFFYSRGMSERAISAITLDQVLAAVLESLAVAERASLDAQAPSLRSVSE